MGRRNGIGIHGKQQRLFRQLHFGFFRMVTIVQPDTDQFLRVQDGSLKNDGRFIEQKSPQFCRGGRRFVQKGTQLIFEDLQSGIGQRVFDSGDAARELQDVMLDGIRNVKDRGSRVDSPCGFPKGLSTGKN